MQSRETWNHYQHPTLRIIILSFSIFFLNTFGFSQVSLRMQGELNCTDSVFTLTLEIGNAGSEPQKIGNSSFQVKYDSTILAFQAYNSQLFDSQTSCGGASPAPWLDHLFDGHSTPGIFGLTISMHPDSVAYNCTELLPGTWYPFGELQFELRETADSTTLQYVIQDNLGITVSSINAPESNDGTATLTLEEVQGYRLGNMSCDPAYVAGKLSFQGRQDQSAVLSVWAYTPEDLFRPKYVFTPRTNAAGEFQLENIEPGSYYLYIKYTNTLSRVDKLELKPGENSWEVANLRGGDSNGDNTVNLSDFSYLLNAYNSSESDSTYSPMSDYDLSKRINILDFTILLSNYNQSGESVLDQDRPQRVADLNSKDVKREALLEFEFSNAQTTLSPGDTLDLWIKVIPGSMPIDGVETHLTFDPSVVHLVDIQMGRTLEAHLLQSEGETPGTLGLAAGTFQGGLDHPFNFAKIRLAADSVGNPNIQLRQPKERETAITHQGFTVLHQVAMPETPRVEAIPVEDLLAFPNPSQGSVTLQSPPLKGDGVLSIFDMTGRLVRKTNWCQSCPYTQDLYFSMAGTYLVNLRTEFNTYSAILHIQ